MDEFTRNIMRCLQWPQSGLANRPTYWAIAKKLGASPQSVRARLDSLLSSGVIKHFRITIDSSFLGLEETVVPIRCTDTFHKKIAAKIELFDFIETVHIIQPLPIPNLGTFGVPTHDSSSERFAVLHVLHRGREELIRDLNLVREVCGDFSIVQTLPARLRSSSQTLHDFDLRLLDLLRREPLIRIAKIAEKLHTGRGRIRRRLERLSSLGVFQIEPVVNTLSIRNALTAIIVVMFEESHRTEIDPRLDEVLGEHYFALYRTVVGSSSYFCCFETISDISSTYERLGKMEMVREVAIAYSSETIDNSLHIPLRRPVAYPKVRG